MTHFVGIQSDVSDLVNHKKAELAAKHEAAQASVLLSPLLSPPAVTSGGKSAHSEHMLAVRSTCHLLKRLQNKHSLLYV